MRTMKDLLKAVWVSRFAPDTKIDEAELRRAMDLGLVEKKEGGYTLTKKGRDMIKVVVAGGTFDILHPGHGFFLEKAREKGDLLLVIIARDSTVKKRKRIPIIPEDQRREMVSYLKPVDVAILGLENTDFLNIIEEIRPDVIALGPDQHHRRGPITEGLKARGMEVEVVRVKEYKECAFHSSRKILKKCMERGYPVENKDS